MYIAYGAPYLFRLLCTLYHSIHRISRGTSGSREALHHLLVFLLLKRQRGVVVVALAEELGPHHDLRGDVVPRDQLWPLFFYLFSNISGAVFLILDLWAKDSASLGSRFGVSMSKSSPGTISEVIRLDNAKRYY